MLLTFHRRDLVIEAWGVQSATIYTTSPTLTAGVHEVKVEYYGRTGAAVIQVFW